MGTDVIEAYRWGDIERTLAFTDTAGDPLDFTGHTISAHDVPRFLDGLITLSFSDAAGGVVRLFIEGTAGIPLGAYQFRIQILDPDGLSVGADSDGFPPIRVTVV